MTEPQALASGRYLLVQKLGEGGMATVYRAFDQRLQVWRAVKVLLPEYSPKKKIMARFEAEAQTMALLEHPNIVRVYDVGSEGSHAYIVMELVEGGSLVDWLEQHGAMPARMAIDVIVQTCQALAFAHGKGVVHRDIKPHNIMVDRDGSCRLTDFGIARAGDADVSLTKTGAVMGTWGYMAPEQRTDAKHVDERADIYAMAATLYSLLTDKTPMDLFAADRDSTMLDGVPEPLVPVLVKATEYHKESRYDTADALAAALLGVRDDLPPDPATTPPLVGNVGPAPERPPPTSTSEARPSQPPREDVGATILPDAESMISGQLTMPPMADDDIEPASQKRAVFDPNAPSTGHDDEHPGPSLVGGGGSRSKAPLLIGLVALLAAGSAVGILMMGDGEAPPVAPTPVVTAPVATETEDDGVAANDVGDEPTATAAAAKPVSKAPASTKPKPTRPAKAPPATATEPPPSTPAAATSGKPSPTPTPGGQASDPAPSPAPEAASSEGSTSAPMPAPEAKPAQCIHDVNVTKNADSLGFRVKSCLGANQSTATLHYRAVGESTYFTKVMSSFSNQHVTKLADASLLGSGVEYFIESEGVTKGSATKPKRWRP